MKKIILLFVAALAVSCSSDSESSNANFESSLVVDGIAFKPNRGTYGSTNGQVEGQTGTFFAMQKMNGNQLEQALYINVLYPIGSAGPEGEFDFGPGTSDQFLANASFSDGQAGYVLTGTSVTVTQLADDEFRFTFNDPVALLMSEGFAEKPMSGTVRAKLAFTE